MTEHVDKQYSSPDALFGFSTEGLTNTNAPGSDAGGGTPPATLQHGQLGSGVPGHDLTPAEVTHTGAPGSQGPTPPSDGGTVTVTNGGHAGIPDGTKTGSTSTSKNSLHEPFTGQNNTDTGVGSGSPGHSNDGGHDDGSHWKKV